MCDGSSSVSLGSYLLFRSILTFKVMFKGKIARRITNV